MFEAIIYVLERIGRGIIQQMGVNVERELDGAVPSQILDALKRCAAEDKLGYICMSELMGRKMKIERCAVAPERHFIPKLQTDADLFSGARAGVCHWAHFPAGYGFPCAAVGRFTILLQTIAEIGNDCGNVCRKFR